MARQNAARAASQLEDEETRGANPFDAAAARAMGIAESLDFAGVADETRGVLKVAAPLVLGAALPLVRKAQGKSALPSFQDVAEDYATARDAQREAQAQLEEEHPGDVGAGRLFGDVAQIPLTLMSSAPKAAASVFARAPGFLRAVGGGALTGTGFGAASGFGHASGDVGKQFEQTAEGGLRGAALGAAGAALPATTRALAPEASEMGAGRGFASLPGEALSTVGGALRRGGLTLAANAAEKAPYAIGGAIGGLVHHPVIGAAVGKALLGDLGAGLAGRLRVAATPPPEPLTEAKPSLRLQDEIFEPSLEGQIKAGLAEPRARAPRLRTMMEDEYAGPPSPAAASEEVVNVEPPPPAPPLGQLSDAEVEEIAQGFASKPEIEAMPAEPYQARVAEVEERLKTPLDRPRLRLAAAPPPVPIRFAPPVTEGRVPVMSPTDAAELRDVMLSVNPTGQEMGNYVRVHNRIRGADFNDAMRSEPEMPAVPSPPPPEDMAASMIGIPVAMRETALATIEKMQGAGYAAQVRAALARIHAATKHTKR